MNALTLKDADALSEARLAAKDYDAFNGTPAYGVYGIEGVGDYGLAGVRTSRRAEGMGEMFGLGFLDTQILGFPLWAVALAGVAGIWILPKLIK